MKIQVVSVGPVTSVQGPKAAYSMFELGYVADGRSSTRKVNEYNREVFGVLKSAEPGSWWDIKLEKDKTGKYWNWMAATKAVGDAASSSPRAGGSASYGGDRETREERALRQVYIIRQSSIANAVAFLGHAGTKGITPESVIQVAKQFEKYVFDIKAAAPAEVTDDDPETVEIQ